MKDHSIGQMHNDLRDTAIKFVGAQQLRERLVRVVSPLVKENKAQRKHIEKLELEISIRDGNYG